MLSPVVITFTVLLIVLLMQCFMMRFNIIVLVSFTLSLKGIVISPIVSLIFALFFNFHILLEATCFILSVAIILCSN